MQGIVREGDGSAGDAVQGAVDGSDRRVGVEGCVVMAYIVMAPTYSRPIQLWPHIVMALPMAAIDALASKVVGTQCLTTCLAHA